MPGLEHSSYPVSGEGFSGVALVTGASGSLGQAISRLLARRGHPVALQYLNGKEKALRLASQLRTRTIAVRADVSSYDDVRMMEELVRSSLGEVSVVVTAAGIRRDALLAGQSEEDWRRTIEVNLLGTFNVVRAVLPRMLVARIGRVITVVSPAGLVGSPGQTAYSASKAGVIGMTRSLAHECGRRGVTVNALSPGFVETDLTVGVPAAARDRLSQRIALRRAGQADEIAEAVHFILDTPYMTGQVVSVDGGLTA